MNFSNRLFILGAFLVLSLIIGILQWLAVLYFLYFEYWWLDIIMHFLGGAWVAMIALIFLSHHLIPEFSEKRRRLIVFGFVLTVGILWEVFEYILGVAVFHGENYVPDTVLDLILDIFGAILSYTVFFWYTKVTWPQN